MMVYSSTSESRHLALRLYSSTDTYDMICTIGELWVFVFLSCAAGRCKTWMIRHVSHDITRSCNSSSGLTQRYNYRYTWYPAVWLSSADCMLMYDSHSPFAHGKRRWNVWDKIIGRNERRRENMKIFSYFYASKSEIHLAVHFPFGFHALVLWADWFSVDQHTCGYTCIHVRALYRPAIRVEKEREKPQLHYLEAMLRCHVICNKGRICGRTQKAWHNLSLSQWKHCTHKRTPTKVHSRINRRTGRCLHILAAGHTCRETCLMREVLPRQSLRMPGRDFTHSWMHAAGGGSVHATRGGTVQFTFKGVFIAAVTSFRVKVG